MNRERQFPWFATAAIVVVASAITVSLLLLWTAKIEAELDAAEADDIEKEEKRLAMLRRLMEQIEERERELAALKVEREVEFGKLAGRDPRSTAIAGGFDAQVEVWMKRVDRLGKFLQANQRYRIPEMSMLTAQDWLAVTQANPVVTEADYRIALSKLRQAAKLHILPSISKALATYFKEEIGEELSIVEELAPYLDDGVAQAVLSRYRIMSPGEELKGMRLTTGGRQTTLIEKEPVDAVWDSTSAVREDARAMTWSGIDGKTAVEAAFKSFRSERGREPASIQDLQPYLAEGKPIENLELIFDAIISVPNIQPAR